MFSSLSFRSGVHVARVVPTMAATRSRSHKVLIKTGILAHQRISVQVVFARGCWALGNIESRCVGVPATRLCASALISRSARSAARHNSRSSPGRANSRAIVKRVVMGTDATRFTALKLVPKVMSAVSPDRSRRALLVGFASPRPKKGPAIRRPRNYAIATWGGEVVTGRVCFVYWLSDDLLRDQRAQRAEDVGGLRDFRRDRGRIHVRLRLHRGEDLDVGGGAEEAVAAAGRQHRATDVAVVGRAAAHRALVVAQVLGRVDVFDVHYNSPLRELV